MRFFTQHFAKPLRMTKKIINKKQKKLESQSSFKHDSKKALTIKQKKSYKRKRQDSQIEVNFCRSKKLNPLHKTPSR